MIPVTLGDIVLVSNILAGPTFLDHGPATNIGAPMRAEIADERYLTLLDEIENEYQELMSALMFEAAAVS